MFSEIIQLFFDVGGAFTGDDVDYEEVETNAQGRVLRGLYAPGSTINADSTAIRPPIP